MSLIDNRAFSFYAYFVLKEYEEKYSASIYLGPVKLRISQDMNLDFQ